LQALVRSRLLSKASTLSFLRGAPSTASAEEVADLLATLILRAFISALPQSGAGEEGVDEFNAFASGGRRPQVRVFACGGAVVERSQCLVDAVLLDVALPLGCTAAADRWCEGEDLASLPSSSSSGLRTLCSVHARSLDDNGVLEIDDEIDGGGKPPIRTAFYNVSLSMDETDLAADRLHISTQSSVRGCADIGQDNGLSLFDPSQVKRCASLLPI
jgi:hypothetical protein